MRKLTGYDSVVGGVVTMIMSASHQHRGELRVAEGAATLSEARS